MIAMDRLLCSHPNLQMEKWVDYARAWGSDPQMKDYYEKNARRLVTIWGPPVDDYSARIWSGLIRDYFLPRWEHFFNSARTGERFDFAAWERDWVENKTGFSETEPFENILDACCSLIKENMKK